MGFMNQNKEVLILGDGKQELSEEEIRSALKGKIDEDTHIFLCGHWCG